MHELHRYRAVYWGGALLALELDVELRRAGTSLDAVLNTLLAENSSATLEAFAAQVDASAGQALYAEVSTRHLDGPALERAALLFDTLGIGQDGSLRANAQDSALRVAIGERQESGK